MVFRSSVVQVIGLSSGITEAKRLIAFLQEKTFDIVSSHSRHDSGQTTLEDMSLKSTEPEVTGSLVKIRLSPRRSLSFDVKEKPAIFYISERQVRIERRLASGDKLVRTILVR